ncbi:MAG: LON peptidase substrate-binding domain-containing protein, partial [Candidatus Dormibacteraeota bacterium]|nr:LON peptidase substrate-binding domain-containing protein [Candidatus Dormibacteraeota bacterium]
MSEPTFSPQPSRPEPSAGDQPVLPALILPTVALFPGLVSPFMAELPPQVAALEAASSAQELLGVFWSRGASEVDRAAEVGVSARIARLVRIPTGQIEVVLQGVGRVRRLAVTAREPYPRVQVRPIPTPDASIVGNPLREAVVNSLRAVAALSASVPEQAVLVAANLEDAGQLADLAAGVLDLEAADRQRVLEV